MATPQSKIDELNATLFGEDIEFLRTALAFGVAKCVVEYEDPHLLNKFPQWVTDEVKKMCKIYRQHGSYRVISNVGDADHSEMVCKLVALLEHRE